MIAAVALLLAAATPAQSFDQLKQLVGVWRPADRPDSPLHIRFSLTAGGTVLVESWERGDQPHSLTLYHRDDETLIATHTAPRATSRAWPSPATASASLSATRPIFRRPKATSTTSASTSPIPPGQCAGRPIGKAPRRRRRA